MAGQKSTGIATFLSFLIPGLGQIYVGRAGRGIGFIVLDIVFALMAAYSPVGYFFIFIIWVCGMYDAYKLAEATHKTVSQEDSTKRASTDNAPSNNAPSSRESGDTSLKILKHRYAEGEITKKQFDRMKKDLEE